MTDYLLTALIPMALFFVVLYGSKEAENQNGCKQSKIGS